MATRQKRPAKRSNNGPDREQPQLPPLPDLSLLLPPTWRRSEAWQHFRNSQVEFLTGMQVLLNDVLERLKLPDEQHRQIRRIEVEK